MVVGKTENTKRKDWFNDKYRESIEKRTAEDQKINLGELDVLTSVC